MKPPKCFIFPFFFSYTQSLPVTSAAGYSVRNTQAIDYMNEVSFADFTFNTQNQPNVFFISGYYG